tara:strand:+ start:159 stop:728 length:570 start_codon:yes stop_codon:yes gene_type:complete
MKLKILGIIGLVFLIINQIMLTKGDEFLQAQQIDFAHWFLLFGALFTISFSYIFPKSIFNTIATVLTILGIIAHIGMATIDFVIWSFGDDHAGMTDLILQLRSKPLIWLPFMSIGPSLLFIGLATHAWKFIKTHPLSSILTIGGSIMMGLSAFLWGDNLLVVLAYIIFSAGLVLLIYRKEKKSIKIEVD